MPSLDLGPVVGPQGEQGATGAQGIRGEQGLPGPNQVTNSTATPLTGILTGNGSVVGVANIDAAPTPDSTGFAQSGGTDKAIKARMPVYGKGKNLFRNWCFVGGGTGPGVFPVNQRGASSYTANGYTIDGWSFSANGYVQTLLSSGLQLTGNRNQYYLLNQRISDVIAGKTVTFAIWSSYGLDKRTLVVADGNGYALGDHFSLDISINTASHYIYLGIKSAESTGTSLNIVFYAVGLYLGSEQTLCHNEGTAEAPVWVLNEVPDYEYELYRCMTSTADSSDTYANKTLATGEEIAKVLHDPAGQNVAVGEYAIYNGQVYKANTAITSSMAASTFASYLTAESGGGLNALAKQVQFETLTLSNTGSISPNVSATVTGAVPSKAGYEVVAAIPGYAGDDQFCWVNCGLSNDKTSAVAQVRNVSSVADSGAPNVILIYLKT